MKTKLIYIKGSAVKALIRQTAGKRTSKEFLEALDRFIAVKVEGCAREHNGGKKTVDASVAAFNLGVSR